MSDSKRTAIAHPMPGCPSWTVAVFNAQDVPEGTVVAATPEDVAARHKEELEKMRHVTNEWADMASNAIQGVRNIADGISTSAEVLELLLLNLKHCQDTYWEAQK